MGLVNIPKDTTIDRLYFPVVAMGFNEIVSYKEIKTNAVHRQLIKTLRRFLDETQKKYDDLMNSGKKDEWNQLLDYQGQRTAYQKVINMLNKAEQEDGELENLHRESQYLHDQITVLKNIVLKANEAIEKANNGIEFPAFQAAYRQWHGFTGDDFLDYNGFESNRIMALREIDGLQLKLEANKK